MISLKNKIIIKGGKLNVSKIKFRNNITND